MPVINILPPHVADMIAAGEVVERPASAVKELLENAFDALAKNVTVELRSGGAEYIRVTDDGCGMAPEDAGVCFLRHATSKLADERGLEAIGTMGFRGEALAAIGAVSHVELLTRQRGAVSGTRLTLSGGDIEEMEETGCPEGTTVIIRGLFFNTPARLKFMKTDKAEGAACVAAALRCALGRPEISVRCVRDGREEFFTPGDGRASSAAYALLGRESAVSLLPVGSDDGSVAVSGFISRPSAGRGSRTAQYFFCNGRYIRSTLLQAAVEQAYKNTLLTGRFPACVIYLTLGAGSVDVNVHPAKTEVKFSDERRVFDAVYYAARGALETPSEVSAEENALPPISQARMIPPLRPAPPVARKAPEPAPNTASAPLHGCQVAYQTKLDPGTPGKLYAPGASLRSPAEKAPAPAPEPPQEEAPPRLIGETMGLYILAEYKGELYVIDKHAAHERMVFDRLSAAGGAVMSQTLLEPRPFRPGPELAECLERETELLSSLGFEAECWGPDMWALRSVPEGLDADGAATALEELLSSLSAGRRPDPRALRDEALKTVACKAAIKAGWDTAPRELQALAEEVCSGRVLYCPHGRPVSRVFSRTELDKLFKRIV